jgi:hypothetical protein
MATYRLGNHQPQNLYRDDQYIGVMFDPETAAEVIAAMNERDRLAKLERDVMEHLTPPQPAIQHHPQSPGGDGLGYGPCTGCGELWPCKASRGERP